MSGDGGLFDDVGPEKRSIPIVPIAAAMIVLAALVFGLAYFSMTPFGAEVDLSEDIENAIKAHFAKQEKRLVERISLYSCNEFLDSLTSKTQNYAAIVELGPWRPNIELPPDAVSKAQTETVFSAKLTRTGSADWDVASRLVSGADYSATIRTKGTSLKPCSL